MGLDVVRPEFIDGPGDGKVLFAQILCGENLVGRELFNKKCTAAYLGRRCCRCCHRSTPVTTRLDPREGSCGVTGGSHILELMGPRTFAALENCVSLYHLLVDNVKSKARSGPGFSVPQTAWCSVCNGSLARMLK